MSSKEYKIDEAIDLGYQASGHVSGLSIIAEIYDETGVKDTSNFPDVTLVEVGSSGTYRGSFIPDAEGTWQVITYVTPSGDGQVVKNYSVGFHNVHSVGDAIVAMNVKIDDLDTKVDSLDTPPMAF